jgi:hypothetical protein
VWATTGAWGCGVEGHHRRGACGAAGVAGCRRATTDARGCNVEGHRRRAQRGTTLAAVSVEGGAQCTRRPTSEAALPGPGGRRGQARGPCFQRGCSYQRGRVATELVCNLGDLSLFLFVN